MSVSSGRLMKRIEGLRPGDADELHRFVELVTGIRVGRRAVIEGNDAPFDYLLHSYFEGGGDVVVWANRGGGKTYLGAVATLLDLLFKPGIQVRILSGSLDQAGRMYDYLRDLVEGPVVRGLVVGGMYKRRLRLVNRSAVEVLSQSERSVRGQRVHKVRCDEVELFDVGVWDAVQRVTRSGVCGGVEVTGSVEVFSTMHTPYGLMSRLVDRVAESGGARLLRWGAMDVIERCPEELPCDDCCLWPYCGGRAKEADGFTKVGDLVAQRNRTTDKVWRAEMMCDRPGRQACVYSGFDPGEGAGFVREVVLGGVGDDGGGDFVVGGIDFGLRDGLAMLWARVSAGGVLEVFGEYLGTGATLEQNLLNAERKGWPRPAWWGVDPAGNAMNSQTGLRDVDVLRRCGHRVRSCRSQIKEGVEAIRGRLEDGRLVIDPGCVRLIEAMGMYHFDQKHPEREQPVKDGPDHICDALRYMVVNLDRRGGAVEQRRYL